jgi:hypothetical protein
MTDDDYSLFWAIIKPESKFSSSSFNFWYCVAPFSGLLADILAFKLKYYVRGVDNNKPLSSILRSRHRK